MKAFPGKRSTNMQAQLLHERRNPTAGRTGAESNRIRRDCERLATNLELVMSLTYGYPMRWFPIEDVVTDRDDEAIIDWRAVAENQVIDGYATDDTGLLVNMQDDGIQASNRIEVVTVYTATDGGVVPGIDYMLRKTIYCPFECPEWGSLPLTLHQWSIIALPLIKSRVQWQWTEALRWYAERNGITPCDFEFSYNVGWNLVPPRKPAAQRRNSDQDAHIWTGPIIYFLSTNLSLNRNMTRGCLT